MLDGILPLLNIKASVSVCGIISHYNAMQLPDGLEGLSLLIRTINNLQLAKSD